MIVFCLLYFVLLKSLDYSFDCINYSKYQHKLLMDYSEINMFEAFKFL